ncbi:MAG: tRNA (adenosine(37)-N6)-dimethylallyltransferase MiaA, partial [Deltaproteobacteria bacterium]|nr:tRNA (adenosine(37)-N6)-dimethylallyltransferase MiaA [Deltaproteobacteria bacterium]
LHAAHAAAPDRLSVAGVWLDHTELDARIDARVAAMVAAGYVAEVERLVAAGYGATKPMNSLGYRHFAACVAGAVDLDEAIRATRRDTRRFARKQRNWRKVLGWGSPGGDPWDAANRAAERAWATERRLG